MARILESPFVRWALLALLLLAPVGRAEATTISMGALAEKVDVNDQVSITVSLDTGPSLTGITLLSIGVLFSDSQLAYRKDLSSTSSYILFGGKGSYLNASTTCGGAYGTETSGSGCSLRVGTTNQVNIDFICTDVLGGTDFTGSEQLATLVFDVIAVGDGEAEIDLSLTSPGNVIGLAGGAVWTAELVGGGVIPIPEPGTALLVGSGLLVMGIARRRRA